MWEVRLLKNPENIAIYKSGFFPRRFGYKKEAMALKDAIKNSKGDAVVVKVK